MTKKVNQNIYADYCTNGLVYKSLDGLSVGQVYKYKAHQRFSDDYDREAVITHLYKCGSFSACQFINANGGQFEIETEKVLKMIKDKRYILASEYSDWKDYIYELKEQQNEK
jgi:hypothetical protein